MGEGDVITMATPGGRCPRGQAAAGGEEAGARDEGCGLGQMATITFCGTTVVDQASERLIASHDCSRRQRAATCCDAVRLAKRWFTARERNSTTLRELQFVGPSHLNTRVQN